MIFLYWNVRVLTNLVRKYLVRDEIDLRSMNCGTADIIFLQEIKIYDFIL